MSSPSPGPPSVSEHTYQPSETSDHGLLNHSHSCLCPEKTTEQKNEANHAHCHPAIKSHAHHHNIIGITHAPSPVTNHTHSINQSVHVHVHASPKTGHAPKIIPPNCNCHLQNNDSSSELHETGSRKLEADDSIEVSPLPPALPPRPPPRPRTDGHGTLTSRSRRPLRPGGGSSGGGGIRKYVFWCTICGGFATILGALFLAVYFMLRSYTSTLGYFETIPTFVPATMLILTGLCVMSLARRRNRYSYLIKVCGVCCLVCALTCVLVTITTTVIHMNRLQTLRECVYTQKTRTCTCYSVLLEAHADTGEGMRFVFDSTPDCEVIHGALYSCLRAMFGLSVSGILVCIFSCMLVYQLLSHERKKMYWEQLELRCRSLYQQQGSTISTQGSGRGPPIAPVPYCSCCEECRYPPVPTGHVYPWDTHALDRFWTPGRVGNFYSPNPGEEGLPPGEPRGRERAASGWSWRRLPWNRGNNQQTLADTQRDGSSIGYHGAVSSPDSQYGFSNRSAVESGLIPSGMSDPMSGSTGSYSMLDNRPVGGVYVWGPPPPYSNPNSPARRLIHSPARYHHIHHHQHAHTAHCQMNEESQSQSSSDCQLRRTRPTFPSKDNYENTPDHDLHTANNDNSENTDTSSCQERVTNNTLPSRKAKKRMDILSVKSIIPNANFRTNVQNIFTNKSSQPSYPEEQQEEETSEEHSYQEPNLKPENKNTSNMDQTQQCRFLPRLQGVENAAFQNQEAAAAHQQKPEPTESEVYFADVSSCCNISVRNDGQDSSLYDEALEAQKPRLISLQCVHKQQRSESDNNPAQLQNNTSNTSFQESTSYNENEDYLAQRIGKRQMSTRSRLPFPLPNTETITLSELGSDQCLQLISKDISQNSLGSVQTPMTESTDDGVSPLTPSFPQNDCCYFPENTSHEQHNPNNRHRNYPNECIDQFLAPDAQYEIIQQQTSTQNFRQQPSNYNEDPSATANQASFSNLTNTISGLNNFNNHNYPSHSQNYNAAVGQSFNSNFNPASPKSIPPKTLNLNTNSPRRGIGSNISTLIQNLGVNPVGLLYGEANSTDEDVQAQACHSDGTMDSGWQSGSEKQDPTRNDNSADTSVQVQRPVNV